MMAPTIKWFKYFSWNDTTLSAEKSYPNSTSRLSISSTTSQIRDSRSRNLFFSNIFSTVKTLSNSELKLVDSNKSY